MDMVNSNSVLTRSLKNKIIITEFHLPGTHEKKIEMSMYVYVYFYTCTPIYTYICVGAHTGINSFSID